MSSINSFCSIKKNFQFDTEFQILIWTSSNTLTFDSYNQNYLAVIFSQFFQFINFILPIVSNVYLSDGDGTQQPFKNLIRLLICEKTYINVEKCASLILSSVTVQNCKSMQNYLWKWRFDNVEYGKVSGLIDTYKYNVCHLIIRINERQ